MRPAGLAAFAARKDADTGVDSHETAPGELVEEYLERLRTNEATRAYFESQPPW
jgi:hypothetical protein